MSPEERGAEIFRKWNESHVVTRQVVKTWMEAAKKTMAQEFEYGFYQAEQKAMLDGSLRKVDE